MTRKGLSYWETDCWYDNHDYVIVGAGIVGMMTALYLRDTYQEAKILLVDRGHLPTGGSTKNAGFLCFGSVGELMANIKQHDEAQVIQIINRRIAGLNLLKKITDGEDIGYHSCGGYEVSTTQEEVSNLTDHLPYLNAMMEDQFNLKETFSLTHHRIGQLASTQIFNQYEGSIHTGKLISTLIRKCHERQIVFLPSTEVQSISEEDGVQQISTDQGLISGRTVVCCTNAFSDKLIKDIDIHPQRNQVILTNPIDHQLPDSCFHVDQGYLYFRPIGDRILIGGARNHFAKAESTDTFDNTPEVLDYLTHWVSTNLTKGLHVGIEMQWSGILGTGSNLHPIIQQVKPKLYLAARMNGMGVAIGTKVAKDVVELIVSDGE